MHPCCNKSLQTGTKIIAILQLVLSIICCALGIFVLHMVHVLKALGSSLEEKHYDEMFSNLIGNPEIENGLSHEEKVSLVEAKFSAIAIVLIVSGVLGMLMGPLLLVGANKRNRTLCHIWVVVQIIIVILMVVEFIMREVTPNETLGTFLADVLSILLNVYFVWVVLAFMKELKEEAISSPYVNLKPRV